jgi:hypothetical protein
MYTCKIRPRKAVPLSPSCRYKRFKRDKIAQCVPGSQNKEVLILCPGPPDLYTGSVEFEVALPLR